jgi:hypothetical protein
MTTTTHTCDHCRTEILTSRTQLEARCGPALGETWDLCEGCLAAFRRWLRNDRDTESPLTTWETV